MLNCLPKSCLPVALPILLSSAALLVACGGGGGSGGGSAGGDPAAPEVPPIATAQSNLFPLDSNARWVYATSAGAKTLFSRVAGTRTVGSGATAATGTVVRSVDANDSSEDATTYVLSATGVREYAAADASAAERAFDGAEILRWPVRAGDSWVQLDKTIDAGEDLDGDGRNESLALRLDTTAVASETVTTAAGTFDRCLHQRQTLRGTYTFTRGGAPVTVTSTVDTWYAPGVGAVKTTIVTTGGIAPASSVTETLSGYRVATLSNDTVAPTVQSVVPASPGQPARGGSVMVSAVLSEAIDADSIGAATLTVVDADNRAIPGTATLVGNTVQFSAGQAWASGTYTARLSTAVQDLMGNPLAAARSWGFTVDATAPGLLSSTPAADADDVALDAGIVLRFTEPVAVGTVSSINIRLATDQSAVPAVLSVSGNEITVKPVAALKSGTAYSLFVSGVTDAPGNPMTQNLDLRFRTTQGRFAYPKALDPEVTALASAVGDVNGDGIPDVVFIGQGRQVVSSPGLYVMAGRSDGTLAAPVRVDIGTQMTCYFLDSLVVGDLNGDGRADVAVGSNFCGVQVLTQTAAGALVPGAFLARTYAGILRAADLNGDGRIDLVGVGGNGNSVYIWRQNAAGGLDLLAPIVIAPYSAIELEVGDLNGDGKPDLVLSVSSFGGRDVAVLMQQTNGSFGAPQYLSTGSVWGASSLALGDLNGDGRLDIVASTGGNSPTSIVVFYQAAGNAFGPATAVSTFDGPSAVRVADIDGDGRADVVVLHAGFSSVGIYLQQASGLLAAEQRFVAAYGGNGSRALTLGDTNGDGRIDILAYSVVIRQLPQLAGTRSAQPASRSTRSSVAAQWPHRARAHAAAAQGRQ